MEKQCIAKDDGRYILFYSFENKGEEDTLRDNKNNIGPSYRPLDEEGED